MKRYSISLFKAKLSEILASIGQGQEVWVTDHNRPIARVLPFGRFRPLPAVDSVGLLLLPPLKLRAKSQSSVTLIRSLRDE